MLCAEDEQSRTCWMTAFRLLKVQACTLTHAVGLLTAALSVFHKKDNLYELFHNILEIVLGKKSSFVQTS